MVADLCCTASLITVQAVAESLAKAPTSGVPSGRSLPPAGEVTPLAGRRQVSVLSDWLSYPEEVSAIPTPLTAQGPPHCAASPWIATVRGGASTRVGATSACSDVPWQMP